LALPDGSGFKLLKNIKRTLPEAKVIVLTASAEDDWGLPALSAGADGFVMKTASFFDTSKAIRDVCAGRRYFSAPLIERVLGSVSRGGKITSRFSARELDVLRLTADGLSTSAIGEEINISVKTVETYRARICRKLDIHGFSAFVRFAILSQMPRHVGIEQTEWPAKPNECYSEDKHFHNGVGGQRCGAQ
jgi:DNA-binding NarL/FixJ family response regulator